METLFKLLAAMNLELRVVERGKPEPGAAWDQEWLCLRALKAYGLPAANAELARFGEQGVLVVERFDRKWSSDGSCAEIRE